MTARNIWKITLIVWILFVLLSSTSEVGQFVQDLYDCNLQDLGRIFGIRTKIAQKGFHVIVFAVLGWLVSRSNLRPVSPWVRGVVWCFTIGAVSELIQIAMDSRQPSIRDFLLNGVAGTLSCWLGLWYASRQELGS
jgi:VanZ family protein